MKHFKTIFTILILAASVMLCSASPAQATASEPAVQANESSADWQLYGGITAVLTAGAIAAYSILGLNSAWVPTPQDASSRLESSATITATQNGTTFDQGQGFAPGGVGMPTVAVVSVSALDTGSGNETYSFVLQESADASTWNDAGASVSVTATGVVSVPGFISKRYVRVKPTLAGTTPSITFEAWLNANIV